MVKRMEKIIEIKKQDYNADDSVDLFKEYTSISKINVNDVLEKYKSNINGLTDEAARKLILLNGKNIPIKNVKRGPIYFLLNAFKDHFIIILLFLAVINYSLGDHLGSIIIVLIALISALIRFFQDYSVYRFVEKLQDKFFLF